MSPSSAPVSVNVPFVVSAVLCAATTAEPKDAVAYDTFVILGPAVPPISSVPTVARPVLLIVVEAIVPSVFVPVEEVNPVAKVVAPIIVGIVAVLIVALPADSVPIVVVPVDMVTLVPNVTGPSWRGRVAVLIVAVLIVAVLIVAVLMLAVAIVVVPVEKVLLDPNVTGPRRVEAPSTANVPLLFTPVVDI